MSMRTGIVLTVLALIIANLLLMSGGPSGRSYDYEESVYDDPSYYEHDPDYDFPDEACSDLAFIELLKKYEITNACVEESRP